MHLVGIVVVPFRSSSFDRVPFVRSNGAERKGEKASIRERASPQVPAPARPKRTHKNKGKRMMGGQKKSTRRKNTANKKGRYIPIFKLTG